MSALGSRTADSKLARHECNDVFVGMDIIELLSSGMYVSPITIYREYLQNSVDAIESLRTSSKDSDSRYGKVSITLDHAARSIVIRDNGCGIPSREAPKVLTTIGASKKKGTIARGFRGVGRLSGLAYCRELEFRTKSQSESQVTSVKWDCRALRAHLSEHPTVGDLKRLVAKTVSAEHEAVESFSDHFFEVHLRDVVRLKGDVLLNEQLVRNYLTQVGPVPFAPDFSFAEQIRTLLRSAGVAEPFHVEVNGETLYRPHRDTIELNSASRMLRIEHLELLNLADVDGHSAAVGWIAHHQYARAIPSLCGVGGLRARMGDIQIGDASIFDESFKEPRLNAWCIGEIHVLDRRVVPNGRRDNFEVNHHHYNLAVQIGAIAARVSQRCRNASSTRNATQLILNVIEQTSQRLRERRRLDRAELSSLKAAVVSVRPKLKLVGDAVIRKTLSGKLGKLELALAGRKAKRGTSVVALTPATELVSKLVSNREQARKLIAALQRLAG